MATATLVDYYEILEVPRTASSEEIKEAVKQQRRIWVKRQQAPTKERQREAEDRVRFIDEAERILAHAARRQDFDRQLANYSPPAPDAGARLDASADWLERAKEFLSRSDAHSAAYAARQATEQDGANHDAWATRARASFLINRPQDAVFEFNEAIRIKPDFDEYHFDLGSVYESDGDWNQAMGCYERAASLAPSNPVYRVATASVFLNTGRPDRALPILEEVHRNHPDVGEFNFYLAWALADNVRSYVSVLQDDDMILTSPTQIERVRRDMVRARSLKFDDPELREYIDDRLRWAANAEAKRWLLPHGFVGRLWAILFVFLVGATLGTQGAAIVLVGLAIWGFVALYRIPVWKADAKIARSAGLIKKQGVS